MDNARIAELRIVSFFNSVVFLSEIDKLQLKNECGDNLIQRLSLTNSLFTEVNFGHWLKEIKVVCEVVEEENN